jgi:hypothetical protein
MDPMIAEHDVIEFPSQQNRPDIDVVFTGCRTGEDHYAFDVIDFHQGRIDRWQVPFIRNDGWAAEIKAYMYPNGLPLGYKDAQLYCDDHYMTPHTVQLTPDGQLFAAFGVLENGFGVLTIDTHSGDYEFIGSNEGTSKLFSSTGDFDASFKNFYFASWPMTNTYGDAPKRHPNILQIESLAIANLERQLQYTITEKLVDDRVEGVALPRNLHQVTMSVDGRYIICAPFARAQTVSSSDVAAGAAASKAQFTYMKVLENIITIDLGESKHWLTEIPVPVPAHIEFDPRRANIFYASAHNIAGSTNGTILEGTATLFRLEVRDGKTNIIGSYTDPRLFRITQHTLFVHDDRVLIALTCVPNRLVILDAETMTLWRDVELFEAEPIQIAEAGVLSPETRFTVYSLNPSRDGRFIVLENASDFIVYDIVEDRVLDTRINRCIPTGYAGRGHTRTLGQ